MRFTIKQVGCGSERIGCLTGFVKSPNAVIETPTSALLTQGGSVVHLTADVLQRVFLNPQLLWVPLSNSVHLETGVKAQGEGIAKFAGLPAQVTCVGFHSSNEVTPSGHFEQDKVPLWTKNGKKMVTADRFMDIMETFKPDIILAIADGRTSLNESFKRINKSVTRTCNMLDTCVKRYKDSEDLQHSSLIGVIAGTGNSKKCTDCIEHILKYKTDLQGIALSGIIDGPEESAKASAEKLEEIFKKIAETIPKDLLHIIEGCWNPAVVVAAIEHGWDVFDGSYPIKLTNAGHALTLNFDVTQKCDELCIIDLNDIRYKEEFTPVLEGCECVACKKHTRAYIRHLLNTREMLAYVLLSIHNLHHFDQMFHHARRHIASNTFQVYRRHITKQYELYKSSQITNGEEKIVADAQVDQKVTEKNGINGDHTDHALVKKKVGTQEIEPLQQTKKIRVSNDGIESKFVNGSS